MADLRLDLLNEINKEKYYTEIEMIRLASDQLMNYKEKIDKLSAVIADIAVINAKAQLAGEYFQEAPKEDAVDGEKSPQEQPTTDASTKVEDVPVQRPKVDNVVEQPSATHQSHSE